STLVDTREKTAPSWRTITELLRTGPTRTTGPPTAITIRKPARLERRRRRTERSGRWGHAPTYSTTTTVRCTRNGNSHGLTAPPHTRTAATNLRGRAKETCGSATAHATTCSVAVTAANPAAASVDASTTHAAGCCRVSQVRDRPGIEHAGTQEMP